MIRAFCLLAALTVAGVGAVLAGATGDRTAEGRSVGDGTYELLQLDGASVKWVGAQGFATPVVTYSFIVDNRTYPGARNCGRMAPIATLRGKPEISLEAARAEAQSAFSMWSQTAKIEFQEVPDDAAMPADIMIGVQSDPIGFAFTDVHHGSDANGVFSIDRSLICLNPQRRWKIGFDGDLTAYDLRYTFAHEIGHAIGLDHPSASGELMSFRYEERFRSLQAGDVEGAARLYGQRPTSLRHASAH